MRYAGFVMNFQFFANLFFFFKFLLQFNASLSNWDKNFLSCVKSAMTTCLDFYVFPWLALHVVSVTAHVY